MLIDIHSHLDHPELYDNIDNVISESKKNGVSVIITSGINKDSNRTALALSKKYDIVKCSLGIYPMDALATEVESGEAAHKVEKFDVDMELDWIKKNKKHCIAIGEIGMDLKTGNDVKGQEKLFLKQLELAEKMKKPVVIHSRKAELQVFEILQSTKLKKVVMHCYGGKHKLARKIADAGYYFSIPASIVRSEHFQKIVEIVNINQLFTETDAPLQSPYIGKPNMPWYVKETVKKIALIKGFNEKEVEDNIFVNWQRVFL